MQLIISFLVDFYSASLANRICLVLFFWIFWPGLMYIVGAIGESRLVPVCKHQSNAFMPGDFSLGVMAVALLGLHAGTCNDPSWWGYHLLVWALVFSIIGLVALFVRESDVVNYPYRSGISPTKITHDIIGYWMIPSTLICLGIPALIHEISTGSLPTYWPNWLVFVLALAFYIACVIYDAKRGYTPEETLIRHPEDWQPIWKNH